MPESEKTTTISICAGWINSLIGSMLFEMTGLFSRCKFRGQVATGICLWGKRGDPWVEEQMRCFEQLNDYAKGLAPVFRLRQRIRRVFIMDSLEKDIFLIKTRTAILAYEKGVTDTPEGLWSQLATNLDDLEPVGDRK